MDPLHRRILQTNRTMIIDNIANPIEVVDLLFGKGVFTESMRQEVEAEKTPIAQTRKILDIVPRRGPTAYNILYECLMESSNDVVAEILRPQYTGSHVYGCGEGTIGHANLQQQDELPDVWPNEAIMKADISVKPCNVRSDLVKQNWLSRNVYSMKRRCRGRCLIISNHMFYGPLERDEKGVSRCLLQPRYGTEKDTNDLKILFEQLHFDVEVRKELSAQDMNQELQKESSNSKHNFAECFICVICSHGTDQGIYGIDGRIISLDCVTRPFDGRHCPALRDKPKLFFIQACQGDRPDRSDELDGNIETITRQLKQVHIQDSTDCQRFDTDQLDASKEHPRPTNPTKTDILVACATHPGYVSLRNMQYGSWFLQAVVYVFQKFAWREDIYGLLTLVNNLVARGRTQLNKVGPRNVMQASLFESSLTRKFMFFPGVVADTEF